MKNRYLKIVSALLLLCTVGAALLTSCAPSYKEHHTEKNVAASTALDGKKANAYFFLIEDGSAVMDICLENGDRIQRIELPKEGEFYVSLDFDFAFANAVFQDMNFDGEMDLYIPCSVTTANLEGMAWLWSSDEEKLVLSEELSELYELTVFADEELITSQDYSSPDGILCSEYKWENGKLTKVGEYTVNTAA